MPAKTDKQQRFFFAVKNCKEKGTCKSKLKKAADSMTLSQIEDFTKLENKKLSFKNFLLENNSGCTCTCPSCIDGNCGGCTCPGCVCANCFCR
jgi:hypothetical protein